MLTFKFTAQTILLIASFFCLTSTAYSIDAKELLVAGKVTRWNDNPVIEFLTEPPKKLHEQLKSFNIKMKEITNLEYVMRDDVFTDYNDRGNVVIIPHDGISNLKENPEKYFAHYMSLYDFLLNQGTIIDGACRYSLYTAGKDYFHITASALLIDISVPEEEYTKCFHHYLLFSLGLTINADYLKFGSSSLNSRESELLSFLYADKVSPGDDITIVKKALSNQ